MKNLLSTEILKGIRFTFIRTNIKNKKNVPIGCIAYRSNLDTGVFEFEVSAHNPKDEFNRTLARQVAAGRMLKHPRIITFDGKNNPPTLPELLQSAVKDLLKNPVLFPKTSDKEERILPESLRRAFVDYTNRQNSLTTITEPEVLGTQQKVIL